MKIEALPKNGRVFLYTLVESVLLFELENWYHTAIKEMIFHEDKQKECRNY